MAARSRATSINHLELLGILAGLQLNCAGTPILKYVSESVSSTAMTWAKGRGNIPWTVFQTLRQIKVITDTLSEWKVTHVYREGNRVVDALAALQSQIGSIFFPSSKLTSEIENFLHEDKDGINQIRIPRC
ncbi:hypothetical protein QJS04_geneDACA014754 [Acorus gramineus]|uniref:RNase H type-1 domain-containing protein n=1 Tax=Acorus gramineus TaxID=55184 RepID=A0AAV9BRW5_ACOGR|nr:hypothetical protein QJS04_geneDACA014754 [Acorus gramineus]